MATTLGQKPVGSIVKLKVNGTPREFIVVQQGKPNSYTYDQSCDGTWLMLKKPYESKQWAEDYYSNYEKSTIHQYLNGAFLKQLDDQLVAYIQNARIPYHKADDFVPGEGDDSFRRISYVNAKVFLTSAVETYPAPLGFAYLTEGAQLQYVIRDGAHERDLGEWMLRTHSASSNNGRIVITVRSSGSMKNELGNASPTQAKSIRPTMIVNPNVKVDGSNNLIVNHAPTVPPSINVPETIIGGTTIDVSWGASTDTDSNLAGYKLERSTDGGSKWEQIYQGVACTSPDNVLYGLESIMYRVKAYDTAGAESGYRTSASITVINNRNPGTPASIAVPVHVNADEKIVISWPAASDEDGDLVGYILDRSTDGGLSYSQVYKGDALSYTDTVVRGWETVMYRVKSYDSHNAMSGPTTSPKRTVDNNYAPVITCASGSDLGKKATGFTLSYSVDDQDEADSVTVTEMLDKVVKRTFTASKKTNNSFAVTGDYFQKIINGEHTLTITATDGKATKTKTFTFTKEVTNASITLTTPMDADAEIKVCAITVNALIPEDCIYKVEVTNNGKDPSPVWEDCTQDSIKGRNHIFSNHAAKNGFAFNFRVTAKRGPSGEGGYITSIQGGFQ